MQNFIEPLMSFIRFNPISMCLTLRGFPESNIQKTLSKTAFINSRVAYQKEDWDDKDTDICKAPVIAMLLFVLHLSPVVALENTE